MDCRHAQESILESLVEPLNTNPLADLERHLASCKDCRSFAASQRNLDTRLAEAFPLSQLSPAFRSVVKARIRRDPMLVWPDFLPDLAHVGGCALGIAVLVLLWPRHSEILLAGAAFTGVTLFLQAVLRSYFDTTA